MVAARASAPDTRIPTPTPSSCCGLTVDDDDDDDHGQHA
jgi:hypothetical protein